MTRDSKEFMTFFEGLLSFMNVFGDPQDILIIFVNFTKSIMVK